MATDKVKWFYISDVHVPYHDHEAVEKMLIDLEHEQPTHVVLGGDIVDFFKVSAHDRAPMDGVTFQQELDDAKEFLERIVAAAPQAQVTYIAGNHENRIKKYIVRNAGELAALDVLTVEQLLNLDALGIEYYEETSRFMIDDFLFRHGHEVFGFGGVPGGNARKGINTYFTHYIQGHVHKANIIHVGNSVADFIGVENPCLCEMNPGYMKGSAQWQQGWTIGYKDHDDKWQIMQRVL